MAVEYGNFFIREYVAAIRENDPERCNPFAVVSDQNLPHGIEDSERYEAERKRKGKAIVESGIQTGYEAENKRKGKAVVEFGIQTESKLEGLKQHESGPKDASAYEPEIVKGNNAGLQTDTHANTIKLLLESNSKLEDPKRHESGPKDASESKQGLKQNECGPKDASAYEPETFKGNNAGLQTDTHANTNKQLLEIVMISDSDDDTSRTISDLQMEVVKSQCSNGRTVYEGAGSENSVPADDDAASSKIKLKKIKKPQRRLLADINRELDSLKVKPDIPRAPKVNSGKRVGPKARRTIDLKNDSDDVTLSSLRNHKESQINHKKKKQKALTVKEPQLEEVKYKGSGACDGIGGRKPSGSGSVMGRHVGASGELKGSGPDVDLATKVDREVLVCSLNQNPADYLFM